MKFHRIFYRQLRMSKRFSLSFVKWATIAVLVGLVGGVIGTAFCLAVVFSNTTWEQHQWIAWLLPFSGLFIFRRDCYELLVGTYAGIGSGF